jgi:hypothetical protein
MNRKTRRKKETSTNKSQKKLNNNLDKTRSREKFEKQVTEGNLVDRLLEKLTD